MAGSSTMIRLLITIALISSVCPQNLNLKAPSDEERLPPCAACRMLATEFRRGMEKTLRNKYEGGDAAYEKERGLRYEDSEVRLIEIQELMCEGMKKHSHHCRNLKEENEHHLEDWYNTKRKQDESSLETWLCTETVKVCCPKGHHGQKCTPCAGGAEKPCSGHGTCRGSGTRKGNGTCKCHPGYHGELCDKCLDGYHLNGTTSRCDECDKSCETCREAGSKGCIVCKDGYSHTAEWGCTDIDECLLTDEPPCADNTFCVNYEGGFHCLECDKACESCYADGPDNCVQCAAGFVLDKKVCVKVKEAPLRITFARWAVYFGLVISTVIVSKKSLKLSSAIGVAVAMYIGASEYTTGQWENFDYESFSKSFAG